MSQETPSSRRSILKSGLGIVAAGAVVAGASRAKADEKLAQNLVQYQPTPKDGNKCSACVNFEAPKGCKIVAGDIAPEGWCVAFAPKEG